MVLSAHKARTVRARARPCRQSGMRLLLPVILKADGRPVQQVDANINDESNVRYYAEVPAPCSTVEELVAGNPPMKTPQADDHEPTR